MARLAYAELWPTTIGDIPGRGPVVRWYFHRVAANGKITDPSQAYSTRRAARRGIQRRWPGIEIRASDHRPKR